MITGWFLSNKVKEVRYIRQTEEFCVILRCGGPAGYGETAEEALAKALELNADWLEIAQ